MLRRLALVLAGVAVALVAAELLLRLSDRIPEVHNPLYSFHRGDPELGWRGKPNARLRFRRPDFDALIEHDGEGWRRPDPPPPADPDRRVLVLGDSFTWGWGVSQGEVFTDHLQRRLAPAAAVLNRGVNAYGTSQELLVLRRELAAGPIDVVVLMFFQNDVRDNLADKGGRRPRFELDGDRLVPRNQPARPLLNPLERFLKDHSRAYQLIDFQSGRLARAWLRDGDDAEQATDDGAEVDYRTLPGTPVTRRLLEEMHRLSAQHGARFVLVYIPQRSEIEGTRGRNAHIRAAHDLAHAFAAEAGVPLIDLSEPFRTRAAAGEAVIYPHDEHWTPAGHALAAQVLLDSGLLDESVAPPRPPG